MMKNNKGSGVSEESRQSTVDSPQLKKKANGPEEKAAASRRTPKEIEEGRAKARLYIGPKAMAMNEILLGVRHGGAEKAGPDVAGWKPALQNGDRTTMKDKELDAGALWKLVEDVVVPQLRLPVIDHVVYTHLLRHSRLEGKRRLHFSIPWLAHNIRLSTGPTREAVRRLAGQGALRLVERSKSGHVAEVRLPEEIPGVRASGRRARKAALPSGATDIEDMDFLKTPELRKAIHAREHGRCFYCRRRIPPRLECLDHVVPRARVGCNSYRNLVSVCMECNSDKGERPAEEFLRWLFREHRLGAAELRGRFEALELLAAGKLRPALPRQERIGES